MPRASAILKFGRDAAIGHRMTKPLENPSLKNGPNIVVFDGECVLCSANAQFILTHDHDRRFLLASKQGDYGRQLFEKNDIDPDNPETLVVETKNGILRNSDAILFIYAELGWPWKGFNILRVIPRPIRDVIYRFIARNRYRLFGKRDSCWIAEPRYLDRML